MKWIKDWKRKLTHAVGYKTAVTLLVIALVAVMFFFHLPCPFDKYLNIPCLGCGMSRAWYAAMHLDFSTAFSFHLMFWSVPPMVLCFWLNWEPFTKKWMNTVLYGLVLAGFGINWIWHLLG